MFASLMSAIPITARCRAYSLLSCDPDAVPPSFRIKRLRTELPQSSVIYIGLNADRLKLIGARKDTRFSDMRIHKSITACKGSYLYSETIHFSYTCGTLFIKIVYIWILLK